MKYLIFKINSFRLALEINKIIEIQIPGVNGNTSSEKMLNDKSLVFQEKQVPIINLGELLFNIPIGLPEDFRIILIETNNKLLGLLVDNVEEIIRVDEDNFDLAKKYAPELKTDIICGKFVDEEKDIFVVVPDNILSAVKTL